MERETKYKLLLDYSAVPSKEQHRDRDGVLCCGRRGIVIGRDPDCHLKIDLPYVGRRHAVVRCLDRTFFLEDCDSKDGTLLNDRRLDGSRKYQLLNGDLISIGDQIIEVSIPEWLSLLESGEDADDECMCTICVSTAQDPALPEDDAKPSSAAADFANPLPPIQKPVDTAAELAHPLPPIQKPVDTAAELAHPLAPIQKPVDTAAELANPLPPTQKPEDTKAELVNPKPPIQKPVVNTDIAKVRTDVPDDDSKSLIDNFFAGLQLNPEDLKPQCGGYPEFFKEMGRTLLLAVDGVRKALITHDSFRSQYQIPGTMWNRSLLNPLYNTKIDSREVVKILLTSNSHAIAEPAEAIREATGDFYRHGIAVPTAVGEAIRTIFETFDWRVLEGDFESRPGFTGIGAFKKARFWVLYCEEFDRQLKTLDEIDNSYRRIVAKAYMQAREQQRVPSD